MHAGLSPTNARELRAGGLRRGRCLLWRRWTIAISYNSRAYVSQASEQVFVVG